MMPTTEPSGFTLFLPLIVVSIIVLVPLQQIIHRAGYSRWWCLLWFVPGLNIVGFWLLAYIRWPSLDKSGMGAPLG